MPRAIWSGAVSFGLVNVPVKVYPAVSPKSVRFHQFEQGTGSRIRYRKVSDKTGREVPNDEIVKGHEVSRGRYVMVTPEEIDAARPESSRTVDIEQFVDLAEIDPIFYDSTYYLAPESDKGGAAKAYSLLYQAMEEQGKVGIGRVVIRTKEYLAAVRPLDGVLAMSTMLFADEVVDPAELDELPAGNGDVADRELKMACEIVESLTEPWDPNQFEDTYREQILDVIRRKDKGEEVVAEEETESPSAPVVDLLAALEESVAAAKKGGSRALRRSAAASDREVRDELEEMTVEQLSELARKAEIAGRSKMSKLELVDALSGHRKSA